MSPSILSLTLIIIIVTVVVYLITQQNVELKSKMLFNAYQIKHRREWWRWISHAFIHADFRHLALNMFVLYMFGTYVEARLDQLFGDGLAYFLLLYFGGVLISSLPSYLKHGDNPGYNALGASGATSSILFAYILFRPTSLFYGIVPAFIFGVLYLWYENRQAKTGGTGIAHDAHFWGAVFGFLAPLAFRPSLFFNFTGDIAALLTSFQ